MSQVGKTAASEGAGKHGVSPVLQGVDTCDTAVWFGDLGDVRCNDAGSGGHPHGIIKAYQR